MGTLPVGDYDICSIMHYSRRAGDNALTDKKKSDVVFTLTAAGQQQLNSCSVPAGLDCKNQGTLGQRCGLSAGDRASAERRFRTYHGASRASPETAPYREPISHGHPLELKGRRLSRARQARWGLASGMEPPRVRREGGEKFGPAIQFAHEGVSILHTYTQFAGSDPATTSAIAGRRRWGPAWVPALRVPGDAPAQDDRGRDMGRASPAERCGTPAGKSAASILKPRSPRCMLMLLTFTCGDRDVVPCLHRRLEFRPHRQRRRPQCRLVRRPAPLRPAPRARDRRHRPRLPSFFWPAALAYLIWKCTGYPVPNEAKAFFEKNFSRLGGASGWPWNGAGNGARGTRVKFSSTGNFAFEEYRRRELERLEEDAPPPRRGGDRVRRVRRGAEAGKGPRRVRRLHGKAPPRARPRPEPYASSCSKRSALTGAPFIFGLPFACFRLRASAHIHGFRPWP